MTPQRLLRSPPLRLVLSRRRRLEQLPAHHCLMNRGFASHSPWCAHSLQERFGSSAWDIPRLLRWATSTRHAALVPSATRSVHRTTELELKSPLLPCSRRTARTSEGAEHCTDVSSPLRWFGAAKASPAGVVLTTCCAKRERSSSFACTTV